jgi:hypothetical protein
LPSDGPSVPPGWVLPPPQDSSTRAAVGGSSVGGCGCGAPLAGAAEQELVGLSTLSHFFRGGRGTPAGPGTRHDRAGTVLGPCRHGAGICRHSAWAVPAQFLKVRFCRKVRFLNITNFHELPLMFTQLSQNFPKPFTERSQNFHDLCQQIPALCRQNRASCRVQRARVKRGGG